MRRNGTTNATRAYDTTSSKAHASLVFLNGTIVVMDARDSVAEALAVRGRWIVSIGGQRDVQSLCDPSTTVVVDLAGRSAVPGFIDGHSHQSLVGQKLEQLDVSQSSRPTVDAIVDAVREAAAEAPTGQWIIGRGYDDNRLNLTHPTKWDLDRATSDHPVFLIHRSGHFGSANSLALKLAGITSRTPDPEGGVVERDAQGEPTGVLVEAAQRLVRDVIPQPRVEDFKRYIVRCHEEYLRHGITSSHHAGVNSCEEMVAYIQLWKEGQLRVRTYLMIGQPPWEVYWQSGVSTGFGDEMLKVGAIKAFIDGSLIGRTGWMTQDFEGEAGNKGFPVLEKPYEQLHAIVKRSLESGFQIGVHSIGDKAIECMVDTYEKVLSEFMARDHRLRIEHCGVLRPDLIERIAGNGFLPVTQPAFIWETGDGYIRALRPDRVKLTYPFKTLLERVQDRSVAPMPQLRITALYSESTVWSMRRR